MKKINIFLIASIFVLAFVLRFYKNTLVPAGLYIDEASIGANARSILEKETDEHGEKYPFFFKAFGEYKLPIYIYLTSLSMLFFGKNEFAVRFASTLSGSLTIILVYLLTKKILPKTIRKKTSLFISFFLATSPWHLQFSRAGFEANLALFFFIIATFFVIVFSQQQKNRYFLFALFFYQLTIFTYQSYFLITPIFVLITFGFIFQRPSSKKTVLLLSIIFFITINLVVMGPVLKEKGSVRFSQTSAFRFLQNEPLPQKINKTPLVYLKNYLSYYSLDFLFVTGDGIRRHQIENVGGLFRWQLLPYLAGIYFLVKNKSFLFSKFTLFLFLLAPISAAFTIPSPHTLRSLLMVVPNSIIFSCGMLFFGKTLKKNCVCCAIITLFFTYSFLSYTHNYYFHYPKTSLVDWGANFKEVVEKTHVWSQKYNNIIIDYSLRLSYVYFLFYDNSLKVTFADKHWDKTKEFGNIPVLFLTQYIDENSTKPSQKLLDEVLLPNLNQDIFVQFWEI